MNKQQQTFNADVNDLIVLGEMSLNLLNAIREGKEVEYRYAESDEWVAIPRPVLYNVYTNPQSYRIKANFQVGDVVQAPVSQKENETETFRATVVRVECGVAVALRDKGKTAAAYNFDANSGDWILPTSKRKFKKVIRCESN